MKSYTIVKITLLLLALLFAFSLWQRQPDIDDAWIGEHAYWMAEKGYVKSELMHGITQQHIRHIVHHKFFTLLGASFVSLFGFALFTLKSVSLVGLIAFLWIFFCYQRKNSSRGALWVSMLMIAANAFIFQYAFVYRPEIVLMTLGFVSFITLERGIKNSFDYKWIIVSGLFAGLAAATHLNGLIYISAGGLLLLIRRKPIHAIVLGLAAIPTFAIYFYDFTREFGLNYWIYQVKDAPALYNSGMLPDWLWLLEKPFREQMRFFHSPKEISFTLLFLFLLIAGFKKIKHSQKGLLIYLGMLILSLSAITVHSTSKYLMLYLPLMIVFMSRAFALLALSDEQKTNIIKLQKGSKAAWAIGLLLIYIVVQMVWNVDISTNKFNPQKNRDFTEKYFGKQSEKLNVLAPMNFIFNEITHYNRIQGDLGYADLQKTGMPLQGSYLLRYSDSIGLDYLIITNEYKTRFGMDTLSEPQRNKSGFKTVEINNNFEILKNEHRIP
jgi:hypothetical protein